MPRWIKSIYIGVLGRGISIKKSAFYSVFEKGKPKYKLWMVKNPCGEKRHSIQEFINMKENIKHGTMD